MTTTDGADNTDGSRSDAPRSVIRGIRAIRGGHPASGPGLLLRLGVPPRFRHGRPETSTRRQVVVPGMGMMPAISTGGPDRGRRPGCAIGRISAMTAIPPATKSEKSARRRAKTAQHGASLLYRGIAVRVARGGAAIGDRCGRPSLAMPLPGRWRMGRRSTGRRSADFRSCSRNRPSRRADHAGEGRRAGGVRGHRVSIGNSDVGSPAGPAPARGPRAGRGIGDDRGAGNRESLGRLRGWADGPNVSGGARRRRPGGTRRCRNA
ncbi:hypothetical protein OJF2_39440 [Aquisphaera giovannonii]|uniref:Uncharacterized protein n=1 Tax=Aquisphaera giovannonii TaxID=406548 RepID=A0A5B9W466_9BACT|nr:hypothetical protein OJF2_39440 [Aquisphaera giovannonii]